jgi:hypothetical protein
MLTPNSAIVALMLLVSGCGAVPPVEETSTTRETRVPAVDADAAPVTGIDWMVYAELLAIVVDADGGVDYEVLRQVREPLDALVEALARYGPNAAPQDFAGRNERLAYDINAYNVFVLRGLVDLWPIGTLAGRQAELYHDREFTLDGEPMNLEALETRIRNRFHDVRVRFALANGTVDGPPLSMEPYLPELLEMQLTRAATRFLNRKGSVEVVDGRIVLSGLFAWYADELTPTPVEWIKRHAPGLILPRGAQHDYAEFDWAVNVKAPPDLNPIVPAPLWSAEPEAAPEAEAPPESEAPPEPAAL